MSMMPSVKITPANERTLTPPEYTTETGITATNNRQRIYLGMVSHPSYCRYP